MAKIAQIITQSEMGGAQKHVVLLSKELINMGNEVHIIAAGDGDLKNAAEDIGAKYINAPYMVREIDLKNDIKNVRYLKDLIKNEEYDIVHLHSSKAGLLGRIAARLAKTNKIIYTAHGFVFNEPMNEIKRKVYIILEYIGAKFGKKIIAVSQKDYQCALDYKISKNKNLYYIPNAIGEIDKCEIKDSLLIRKELNLKENDFVVGTVSNFYETKGHKYFIEAAINLINKGFDFKVVFAGEGPLYEEMKEKCRAYSQFKFLGYRKDNYDIINMLDLFVLPSIKEGLPYVVLEAMMLGKPILCTKVGALVDIIENKHNGYIVDPGSTSSIEEMLEYLIKNKEFISDIGLQGQKYVINNYSFSSFMKSTLEVYNEV